MEPSSGYFRPEGDRNFFNYYAMNPLSKDQYAKDNRGLLLLEFFISCLVLYPVLLSLFTLGEGIYRSLANRVQENFSSSTKDKVQASANDYFRQISPKEEISNKPAKEQQIYFKDLQQSILHLIEDTENDIRSQKQLNQTQMDSLIQDFRSLQVTDEELENPEKTLNLKAKETQVKEMRRTLHSFLEGKEDPCKKNIVGIRNYGGNDCWLHAAMQSFAHLPLEYLLYRPLTQPVREEIPAFVQDKNLVIPVKEQLEEIPTDEQLITNAKANQGKNKLNNAKYETYKKEMASYRLSKQSPEDWFEANPNKTNLPSRAPKAPDDWENLPETVDEIKSLINERNEACENNYKKELEKYHLPKEIYNHRVENANQSYQNELSLHYKDIQTQSDLRTCILKLYQGHAPTASDTEKLGGGGSGGAFNFFYEKLAFLCPPGFTLSAAPVLLEELIEDPDNLAKDTVLLLTESTHDTMLLKKNSAWKHLNDSWVSNYTKDDEELNKKLQDRNKPKSAWRVNRNWVIS